MVDSSKPFVMDYGQHVVSLIPQDISEGGARMLLVLNIEKRREFPRRHDGRETDPVFHGIFDYDNAREMFAWLGAWLHTRG